MPKPYPKEFRDDVVRVALSREPGVRIKDIAAHFGITESCLGTGLPSQYTSHAFTGLCTKHKIVQSMSRAG